MNLTQRLLSFGTFGTDWVLVLLALLSLVGLLIILERIVVLLSARSNVNELFRIIVSHVYAGDKVQAIQSDIARMKGMEAGVLRQALDRIEMGATSVEELVRGLIELERIKLERGIALLGGLGIFAPLVGLFGTGLGLIKAFLEFAEHPTGGPRIIMTGLAEALVAVAIGLLVAIPALLCYFLMRRSIDRRISRLDAIAHMLLAGIKTRR